MLLYVLTSDGTSREDGNVFYAGHLLVAADSSSSAAVEALVAAHVGGVKTPVGDIVYRFHDAGPDPANDLTALVSSLAAAGFPAQVMEPTYVIAQNQ